MSEAIQEDAPPGVPEWVVTYGDMMSLLLTFFIMLVSMSELKDDQGSMRAMLDAITERFGATDGIRAVPGKSLQESGSAPELTSKGNRSEGGTESGGQDSAGRAGPNQTVESISHGTILTMGGANMQFKRFEADLTDELKQGLDIVASSLASKSNRIVVRGHATSEPLPPESRYRDSMDLSFARAHSVGPLFSGTRNLAKKTAAQRRGRRRAARDDPGRQDAGPESSG